MVTIHIYDPSLCCSSGVCGEDVDPALVDISAALTAAKADGIEVVRHNLANAPLDFASQPAVKELLANQGTSALPAIVVGERLVLSGRYPTLEELRAWHSGDAAPEVAAPSGAVRTLPVQSTSCCGGSGCC